MELIHIMLRFTKLFTLKHSYFLVNFTLKHSWTYAETLLRSIYTYIYLYKSSYIWAQQIVNNFYLKAFSILYISILVTSCTKNPSQEFQDKALNLSNPPPKRFTQVHGNPLRPNQYFTCDVNGLSTCPMYIKVGEEKSKTNANKLKGEKK